MSDENATSATATPTTAVDPYANYGGSVAAPSQDPYAAYGGSAAPTQTADPNLPKMSPATPSIWDRVKNAITTGIPAFNSSFEAASHTDTGQLQTGEKPTMQIVTPDAAMTMAEKKAHPVLTGVAETAGSLTSAPSVALIAGTAGLGELGVAGKAVLPRLISAGFSAQALKGAYDQIPEFRKALDAGDTAEAERILTHITLDVGMSALGARHAATGGPAISDTAGDAVTAGKRIARGVSGGAAKIGEAADAARKSIPSAERAGKTMEELRAAIGTHPVEVTDELSKAASRVQELADNGNTMPSAARKFLVRITDPAKGHLTYNEARDFMTKFGNMTADEQTKIAPAMKGQMQQLGGALRNAVEATASRGGKLEEFQNSMREYASAKKLQEVADFIKSKGISLAGKAALGGAAYGLYRELKDILE